MNLNFRLSTEDIPSGGFQTLDKIERLFIKE